MLKHGPCTSAEIEQFAGHMRVNSRAAELRKQGHVIVCTRTPGVSGPGAYVYRLLGGPLREREQSAAQPREEPVGTTLPPRDLGHSRSLSDPLIPSPLVPKPSLTTSAGIALMDGSAVAPRPTSGEPPCAVPPPLPVPAGAAQLSLEMAA